MGKITKARSNPKNVSAAAIDNELRELIRDADIYEKLGQQIRDGIKDVSTKVDFIVRSSNFLHPLDQVKAVVFGELAVLNIDRVRYRNSDYFQLYHLLDEKHPNTTYQSMVLKGLQAVQFIAFAKGRKTEHVLHYSDIIAYKLQNSNDWVDFDAETFLREASSPIRSPR